MKNRRQSGGASYALAMVVLVVCSLALAVFTGNSKYEERVSSATVKIENCIRTDPVGSKVDEGTAEHASVKFKCTAIVTEEMKK